MAKLDVKAYGDSIIQLFHLKNANPSETAELVSSLFPQDVEGSDLSIPLAADDLSDSVTTTTSTSKRLRDQTTVIAVPDQRTSSLLIRACEHTMPTISQVISTLDKNQARKEHIYIFQLDHADPANVAQVVRDLFQRSSGNTASSYSRSVLSIYCQVYQKLIDLSGIRQAHSSELDHLLPAERKQPLGQFFGMLRRLNNRLHPRPLRII